MISLFLVIMFIFFGFSFFCYYLFDEYDYMNYISNIFYNFWLSALAFPDFFRNYPNLLHIILISTLFLSVFFEFDDFDEEYKKKKHSNFIFYFFMYLLLSCVILYKINNDLFSVILVTMGYPFALFIFMHHERENKKIKKLSFKKRSYYNEEFYL